MSMSHNFVLFFKFKAASYSSHKYSVQVYRYLNSTFFLTPVSVAFLAELRGGLEPIARKEPTKEQVSGSFSPDLSACSPTERVLFAYERALELAALYVCEMDARRTQAERERPTAVSASTSTSAASPAASTEAGTGGVASTGSSSPTADSSADGAPAARSQRHSELGPLLDYALNKFPLIYMKYDPYARFEV